MERFTYIKIFEVIKINIHLNRIFYRICKESFNIMRCSYLFVVFHFLLFSHIMPNMSTSLFDMILKRLSLIVYANLNAEDPFGMIVDSLLVLLLLMLCSVSLLCMCYEMESRHEDFFL